MNTELEEQIKRVVLIYQLMMMQIFYLYCFTNAIFFISHFYWNEILFTALNKHKGSLLNKCNWDTFK